MKRRILVMVALVVIAAAALALWARQKQAADVSAAATQVQTATVSIGSLVATVSAAGNVSAPSTVEVAFQSSGKVKQVNVKVGDAVKKGDALMELDTADLESALKTAQLTLEDAQASYDSAKIDSEQTTNQLVVAKAALDEAAVTVKSAQADYDTVAWRGDVGMTTQAATLQTATIAYQSALASYKITAAGINGIALKQAQIKVEDAEVSVQEAQRNLDAATLTAPIDGLISEVNYAAGDTASGTAVTIVDPSQLQVQVTAAEVDIATIKVGQTATMTMDALTDKNYNAKVISISPVGTVTSGVVDYTVTLEITDDDGAIKPGMTANVEIEVDRRDRVLLVPTRAIKTVSGDKIVTVQANGKLVPTKVTTGLSDDTSIEITSGLKDGDVVVLNQTTTQSTSATAGGMGILGIGGPPGQYD
jgi:RND family efflux transporter MFP subunit